MLRIPGIGLLVCFTLGGAVTVRFDPSPGEPTALDPRIRVQFSGAIDPETLRNGIRIVPADGGDAIAINQVQYDPATNTAYARPDVPLQERRRYWLRITSDVKDASGAPVEADPAYIDCVTRAESDYCRDLANAGAAIGGATITTMNATSSLVDRAAEARATGTVLEKPVIVNAADLASATWHAQVGVNPSRFEDTSFPMQLLAGVGRLAFTAYGSIPLHVFLPSADPPAVGYPLVVFGHGFGDSRFGGASAVASVLTGAGYAVTAINAFGHGFGPESRLILTTKGGETLTFNAGGRSADLNGDGEIESSEGCVAEGFSLRDCMRHTVVDLVELIAAVRRGSDLAIDPNRIYYVGQSLGAIYGPILMAVEPAIQAAVFNSGGASFPDIARLSVPYRKLAEDFLAGQGLSFVDCYPLRDRPVEILNDSKCGPLQDIFDDLERQEADGDALSYAPLLKGRSVMWQIAKGDRSVPNPAESNLVRAAGGRERTQLYRHDVARAVAPELPEDPHAYLANLFSLRGFLIAVAAQSQIAKFFDANGATIADANAGVRLLFGRNLFETPETLPEELNFTR